MLQWHTDCQLAFPNERNLTIHVIESIRHSRGPQCSQSKKSGENHANQPRTRVFFSLCVLSLVSAWSSQLLGNRMHHTTYFTKQIINNWIKITLKLQEDAVRFRAGYYTWTVKSGHS